MSARAMLSDTIRIVETDMPYHERAGESKLKIAKDGWRFLRVILEAAFLYRHRGPSVCLRLPEPDRDRADVVSGDLLSAESFVAEWMIYRFVVSDLAGIARVFSSAPVILRQDSRIALEQARSAASAAGVYGSSRLRCSGLRRLCSPRSACCWFGPALSSVSPRAERMSTGQDTW